MGWESCGVVGFDLGPLLQGQTRLGKLKVLITPLLVVEIWDGKPTYRKSWAGNLVVWSDFDLGPLLQGQTRLGKLKVLITPLLLVVEIWDGKPTYRKSWAGNLVVWSDLTLGPSFKVKRG